jgi:hypothetical protein
MRDTMVATNLLLRSLDRETASELTRTLQQTRKALVSTIAAALLLASCSIMPRANFYTLSGNGLGMGENYR